MRMFIGSFIVTLVTVVGLGLIGGTAHSVPGSAGGSVRVYDQTGYRGTFVGVENSSDNRGWCIPVGKALPDNVGRSVQNNTGRKVQAYADTACKRGGFNLAPYGARSGIRGGKVYVRSIRIS